MNLEPYNINENLCTCGEDANSTETITNITQCSSTKVKKCNNTKFRLSPLQIEQCTSPEDETVGDDKSGSGDLHSVKETSFIPAAKHGHDGVSIKVSRLVHTSNILL